MSHAADQMAVMNPFSVAPPSVSVWTNMEKRSQEVESLHTALQTASNLVFLYMMFLYLTIKK